MGIEITQNEGEKMKDSWLLELSKQFSRVCFILLIIGTEHCFYKDTLENPSDIVRVPCGGKWRECAYWSLPALHTSLFEPNVNIVFNLTLKAVSDSRL